MKKFIAASICVLFLTALSGCAATQTRQKAGTGSGAIIGAGVGAIAGQVIGGNTKSTVRGAALGAIVGAIAGNQVGAYMDRQEEDLQEAVAASEATSLRREQDILTATFTAGVMFDFDSAVIKPGGQAEISRVANVLNRYPQTMLRVEGHTDTIGNEEYNQKLSERRAIAVKNALIQNGVLDQRITALGLGQSRPISSDHAVNRRVEIVIIPIVDQG